MMAAPTATAATNLFKLRISFFLSSSHRRCPFFVTTTTLNGLSRRLRTLSCNYNDKVPLAPTMRCYCSAPVSNLNVSESSSETNVEEDPNAAIERIREAANTLDIRVGRILKAWRHQEADSLYVEEVDVGEPEPRTICSGLVNYMPVEHLQDKSVVVLANLKPRNMRGVKSNGMLMAASDASHENVELLVPPEGSAPGDRIWFGSVEEKESLPDAATPNQVQKKKIWESVQPHLRTDDSCVAMLGMHHMRSSAGIIACTSLKNARIS